MKDVKTVAFIVRRPTDIFECVRTGAGLAVENLTVGIFIISVSVAEGDGGPGFVGLLEMIEDLEGAVFSNIESNIDRYEQIRYLSLEDMGYALRKYDLAVTF